MPTPDFLSQKQRNWTSRVISFRIVNKYKKVVTIVGEFHGEENKERIKLEKEKIDFKGKGQKPKGLKEKVDFANVTGIGRHVTNKNTLSKLYGTQTADSIKPIQTQRSDHSNTSKYLELDI